MPALYQVGFHFSYFSVFGLPWRTLLKVINFKPASIMSSKLYCCICKKAIYSNYKGKFPTCPAHKGMRPNNNMNNKPPTNKPPPKVNVPTTQAISLSIPSVIKFFQSMVVNNCAPKEFDACVEKLQKITISTFTPKKSQYANKNTVDMNVVKEYITMFNKYSTDKDDTIDIAPGTYDANQWLNLYIECLPKNGLPEYSNEWYSALQWLVHNIIRSIHGVKRTENIAMTKTFDRRNMVKMTHSDYADAVKHAEESHREIISDLEWLIAHPPKDELHQKLLWGVLLLNFDLFDYGPVLNKYIKAINYKVKLSSQTYLQLLTELRKIENPVETAYGRSTCIVIAEFLEGTWLLHYGALPIYEYLKGHAFYNHIRRLKSLFELSLPPKMPGMRRIGMQYSQAFERSKDSGLMYNSSTLNWIPLALTYDEETLMDRFEYIVRYALDYAHERPCHMSCMYAMEFVIASAKSLNVDELLCDYIITRMDQDGNGREHAIRIAAYSLIHGLIDIDIMAEFPSLFVIDLFTAMRFYVDDMKETMYPRDSDKLASVDASAPLVVRYYNRCEILYTIIKHHSDLIQSIYEELCEQCATNRSLTRYRHLAMDLLEMIQ